MTYKCIILLTLSLFQPSSSSFQGASFITNPSSSSSSIIKSVSKWNHAVHYPPFTTPALQMSSESSEEISPPEINTFVSIEYCTGCHWMPRAMWMAQELLTTFQEELDEVCLIPSRPGSEDNPKGGKFEINLNGNLLWDRGTEGHFPEMKQVKQKVRDRINPNRDLGHSDAPKDESSSSSSKDEANKQKTSSPLSNIERPAPHASITYCTGCRWMLRSGWMAQELLTTFGDELNSISLLPSRPPQPGGMFTVTLDEATLWDRKEEGRFPEPKEIKQKIRDIINPNRDLGHSDVKDKKREEGVEKMDDDDAAEMRKFFGVA